MNVFRFRTGAAALALALLLPAAVRADPLLYSTSATFDRGTPPWEPANTISGPSVISFAGVTNGTIDPLMPGPLALGDFVITPSGTATTTYNHTPFSIEIDVPALTQFVPSGQPLPGEHYGSVLVQGHLNGTVSPLGVSSVAATVDFAAPGTNYFGPFPAVSIYFDSPFAPGALQVAGTLDVSGGNTPITATVPEPTSLAAFALALGGLALWRRRAGR